MQKLGEAHYVRSHEKEVCYGIVVNIRAFID